MLVKNKHHVSYCTNIHAGGDWQETIESLKEYVPKIKSEVAGEDLFGLGLRLSNIASEELNRGDNLTEFKKWLDQNGIYVFTMNGFPYGNFHNEVVKDQVHAPDWTTEERVVYTKRLFNQLAYLIPDGMEGGISTSPISYKYWHGSMAAINDAFKRGAANLSEIILHLYALENKTGKYLHLDIEPEPDGLIENSEEVIFFFTYFLKPIAIEILQKELNIDKAKAEQLVLRYITVCYDVCHFSLAYEEPVDTLGLFKKERIKVGKIQVSSALKIIFNDENKSEVWDSLALFNEPTYLHQVTEKIGDTVKTYNDLPAVLEERGNYKELRAHFHVPIFVEKFNQLFSTQDQILKVIAYIKENEVSKHLEIETYTWDVLPATLKTDLLQGIVREIQWLKNRL